MGVIWRGSTEIHEAPNSPRRILTATALRAVRLYLGPYAALFAAAPGIGDVMSDMPGLVVDQVEVVPNGAGPDGPGIMTISLAIEWNSGSDAGQPTYEVEWTMIERDLRLHPRYAGGANSLSTADLAELKKWESEDDEAKRAAFQYAKADGSTGTLSANAQHIAAKIMRGQTSYLVPAPVARRTTYSHSVPTTSGCGQRGNPPAATGYPSGYEWIKTSDRRVRQGGGKWERIEEWTGADKVDPDIYS